jgi:hypothetical protein
MEREELLKCAERVAEAIQASGHEDVHWDFIEILKELREPMPETEYPAFN